MKCFRNLLSILLLSSILIKAESDWSNENWPMNEENSMIGVVGHDSRGSITKRSPQDCDRDDFDCDDACNAKLKIVNLCAKTIKTRCLEALRIKSKCICTERLDADDACISKLNVPGQLNTNNLGAHNACVEDLRANNICAVNGKFNNLEFCNPYRATVVFGADTVYNLGSTLDFDIIVDDPNSNITLFPFRYTAPKNGYYIITLQVDQFGLNPTSGSPILGLPIANPQIHVNGFLFRQNYTPYLSFLNKQNSTYSCLISLKAGDVVTARYNVLILDEVLGFVPVVGTVTVDGNGFEENKSIFKIALVTPDCPPVPCQPCEVPGITGCAFPCVPCRPGNCPPCPPCVQ